MYAGQHKLIIAYLICTHALHINRHKMYYSWISHMASQLLSIPPALSDLTLLIRDICIPHNLGGVNQLNFRGTHIWKLDRGAQNHDMYKINIFTHNTWLILTCVAKQNSRKIGDHRWCLHHLVQVTTTWKCVRTYVHNFTMYLFIMGPGAKTMYVANSKV